MRSRRARRVYYTTSLEYETVIEWERAIALVGCKSLTFHCVVEERVCTKDGG